MSLGTLAQLPAEIRLQIYGFVFAGTTLSITKPLGFCNRNIESPFPEIIISLPVNALLALYRSNPAGQSAGKFWPPVALLKVSRVIRDETGDVLGKQLVEIGTWFSFLNNRPSHLIFPIRSLRFVYSITTKYSPGPDDQYESWTQSISKFSFKRIDALVEMEGLNLENLAVEILLVSPPVFSYRIRGGLNAVTSDSMKRDMLLSLSGVMYQFHRKGAFPADLIIVDGTGKLFATNHTVQTSQ